jgi:hypothetical protein
MRANSESGRQSNHQNGRQGDRQNGRQYDHQNHQSDQQTVRSSDRHPEPQNGRSNDHPLDVRDSLRKITAQLPRTTEVKHLQTWIGQLDWLNYFHRCSRLLIAVIDPLALTLQYANDHFCQLLGMASSEPTLLNRTPGDLGTVLSQYLSPTDNLAVQHLYRRHLLHLVFREFYQIDPRGCRLLEAPAMVAVDSPIDSEPRYVEFWLRSEQLKISRLDPALDEFAEFGLSRMAVEVLEMQLADPAQLAAFEQRLFLDNYRVEGLLLLEGLDVTVRETIRRITQLLIDKDSILRPQKFRRVDQQMRALFRTQSTVILTIEADQIRIFMGTVKQELEAATYPLDSLDGSDFMRAIQTNQVITVPDLALDCQTDYGQQMLAQGARSMLLIPLISQSHGSSASEFPASTPDSQVMGLVGVLSDRPNHFDGLDCCHAEQLIPAFTRALTAAQRQLVQQRFITNIHPAVEWRFMQEAERRSLGFPAEPIVFNSVYPLYGMSDIRGSSEARNRSIQTDLLQQLQLGLAVVEAVCEEHDSALCEQLRLDLLERMQNLQERITVDAEVTEIRYLQNNLETYFEYFSECSEAAIKAIKAYQNACANDHQCVYQARAEYDQTIGQINGLLRESWERWQHRMQQITPHYCDVETTDGIDHMIYAGKSIDPKFGEFQLRSLRYEQLRALCDCARTALRYQAENHSKMQVTHLVLVQDSTVDIFHDETTEKLFDVRGTRDTRYEIVKKRIDKAIDEQTKNRITQPGMLTVVYSTNEEFDEYQQYLHYLIREGWVDGAIEQGIVEPLQGVTGLKFLRVQILTEDS